MSYSRVRRLLLPMAALVGLLLVSACSSSGASQPSSQAGSASSSQASSADQPASGGTLTVYDPTGYGAFNVTDSSYANSQITANITDCLTYQDPTTGNIEPWIASSWTIQDNGKVYILQIRKGVTFSNGEPLNAEAVKLNLDQQGLGNAKLGVPPSGLLSNYVSTTVLSPYSVKVTFSQPEANFLSIISWYRLGLIAPSSLKLSFNAQGEAQNEIGSGPFVISQVADNSQKITLTARENYDWAPPSSSHQGPAYLKKVVFQYVPTPSVETGALESGEADIVRGVQPSQEAPLTSDGIQLYAALVPGTVRHLTFHQSVAPLNDLAVREALTLGTNTSQIVQAALTKNYKAATSILPSTSPYYVDEEKYLAYNPTKAEQLLSQAGWTPGPNGIRQKDGKQLAFTIGIDTFTPGSEQILEVLQQQWQQIGVKINIVAETTAQIAAGYTDPKTPITFMLLSSPDPSILQSEFGSAPGDANFTFAAHPDQTLDKLLAEGSTTLNTAQRKQIYAQVQNRLAAQYDALPLFEEHQVFGIGPKVGGFSTTALARIDLYNIWIKS